ncbi:MAG: hypothetical protein M3R47_01880 [Chloroflexota bacterium]|nr:hypothetical protein [Chloroflexota bacterium]
MKISIVASQCPPAARMMLKTENLDLILTRQKTGLISKNLTVQFHKIIYQIQSDRPDYALRQAQVTVCENAKGVVTLLYKNKPLPYSIYKKQSQQAEVVDTKQINQVIQPPTSPARNHPWRTYGKSISGKVISNATD